MNTISKLMVSATLLSGPLAAAADTISYTGTDGGSLIAGSGTSIVPALMLPANITFTHVLDANTTLSNEIITDNWTFTIPASVFGSTVTGDQISLSNFNVSGVVDSLALYSGTPTSGTLLVTATPAGSFGSYALYTLSTAGSYYLAVQSTLAPNAVGSYTGTLVAAAPVPLPAAAWLLLSGIGSLGALARKRTRPEAAAA